MLIYISGAIANDPDYKRKFVEAEKYLTKKGHDVINPAFVSSVLPELKHEQYLHIDKTLIDICDAVYFLKDWGSSEGAREEYNHVNYVNEKWRELERERACRLGGILIDIKDKIKLVFEGDNEDEL